jgi:hypothetical protein
MLLDHWQHLPPASSAVDVSTAIYNTLHRLETSTITAQL